MARPTSLLLVVSSVLLLLLAACGGSDPGAGDGGGAGGSSATGGTGGGDGGTGGYVASIEITSLDPAEGPEGAAVTVNGQGFATTAGKNEVRFAGGAVAVVLEADAGGTWVKTRVPMGARSGAITLLTDLGAGKITVGGPVFTVAPRPPPEVTAVSGPGYEGVASTESVTGKWFYPESVVLLDGTPMNTGYSGSTTLTFGIPATGGPSLGNHSVAVQTPGIGTSSPVTLWIAAPMDFVAIEVISSTQLRAIFEGGVMRIYNRRIPFDFSPDASVSKMAADPSNGLARILTMRSPLAAATYTVTLPADETSVDGKPIRNRVVTFTYP